MSVTWIGYNTLVSLFLFLQILQSILRNHITVTWNIINMMDEGYGKSDAPPAYDGKISLLGLLSYL